MTPDDKEKIEATAAANSKQKSLELLFDYTKFHIGLYLTLTASYIAATSSAFLGLNIDKRLVCAAVICFMTAGLAGGVIASSITQTQARCSEEFLSERIGPWEMKWLHFRARIWTWIEHTAFWVGLVLAALSILRSDVRPPKQPSIYQKITRQLLTDGLNRSGIKYYVSEIEGLAKFTYKHGASHKHFVTASSRSRLRKATESTTLTEPQPLGRGNGTKAAG